MIRLSDQKDFFSKEKFLELFSIRYLINSSHHLNLSWYRFIYYSFSTKIHDFINEIKSRKKFNIVKSKKSRFNDRQKLKYHNDNKIEYQNDNKSTIFAEKAKKFIKNLFIIINNFSQNIVVLKFFKKKSLKIKNEASQENIIAFLSHLRKIALKQRLFE
jgi:hypothetical protein